MDARSVYLCETITDLFGGVWTCEKYDDRTIFGNAANTCVTLRLEIGYKLYSIEKRNACSFGPTIYLRHQIPISKQGENRTTIDFSDDDAVRKMLIWAFSFVGVPPCQK